MSALRQDDLRTGEPTVIVRPMLTVDRAIGLFLDDIVRRGYSERTRDTYSRMLQKFVTYLPVEADVTEVREEDIERFLGRFAGVSPKTGKTYSQGSRVQADAPLRSFFKWLEDKERIKRTPMAKIKRPKRLHPSDLDVTTVSSEDVLKMLDAAVGWREQITLSVLCYLGPRRRAASRLRLSDYDRLHGTLRFREKGAKTIYKPVPVELRDLLDAAIQAGVYTTPDDYLIPTAGPLSKKGDRSDHFIWEIVKEVSRRVGVKAHPHAMRAAFAVFYIDGGYGDLDSLCELMGHRSAETTRTYLRRRDRDRAKESVRSLSWRQPQQVSPGSGRFTSGGFGSMGAGGFEPPSGDSSISEPDSPDAAERVPLDLIGDLLRGGLGVTP